MAEVTDANPYVILGVDYGCTLKEARRAFVRAVRRIRASDSAAYTEAQATTALHTIEQVISDPHADVNLYRVPADPKPYELAEDGLLSTRPVPIRRRTDPLVSADLEAAIDGEAMSVLHKLAADLDGVPHEILNPYEGVACFDPDES